MDYLDEWRIDLLPEEELSIIYANWESDFAYLEYENLTIAICLHCGNALNLWSLTLSLSPIEPKFAHYFYCGVC